jgi:hypothetical protein
MTKCVLQATDKASVITCEHLTVVLLLPTTSIFPFSSPFLVFKPTLLHSFERGIWISKYDQEIRPRIYKNVGLIRHFLQLPKWPKTEGAKKAWKFLQPT